MIWAKPAHGKYNLNIDASFHSDGLGAAGAVLRNHRGEALAGMACPLDNLLNASSAEASAMLKGLEFLENLEISSACIESDSLELIQACNGDMEIWSPHSAILAECFVKASNIGDISFSHCFREANLVAHHLARNAFRSKQVFIWDGDPPVFILPFVIKDVALF